MSQTLLSLTEQLESTLTASNLFFGHGTDNAFDEAAWMVAHVADIDLAVVSDLPWEKILTDDEVNDAKQLLGQRLSTRKPLAYLINEAWFAGERFYVDERVIVPRSHLGEWIPEQFEPWIRPDDIADILDLCTGSGCIAIALAHFFPDANVTGADLSAKALEVAARNVSDHGLQTKVRLREGDLFAAVAGETFDLITCNPPYVSDELMRELPDEYGFEPAMAFEGGGLGLDLIQMILEQAASHLTKHGVLIMEAGSANTALEAQFPNVPFTWLASGENDAVIFLLSCDELIQYFPVKG